MVAQTTWTFFFFALGGVQAFYPDQQHHKHAKTAAKPANLGTRDNTFDIVDARKTTQKNSAPVDQDGSDLTYMTTVTFGDSKTEYHMLLDSAGSESWIYGSDCTADPCQKHNTLGPTDSSTLQVQSSTFSVGYGTGNVNGVFASDTVALAGLSVPMTFGLVSNASSDLNIYAMDGIIGLGIAPESTSTIMNALSQQHAIPTKIFGIHLSRNVNGENGNDGEIDFGAPNNNFYSEDLVYIDAISDESFWQIPVDGAGVDGKQAEIGSRSALLDTGTSFIYLPPSDAAAIHSLIPGSVQNGEDFTIPCDSQSQVQISFSGTTFNISTKDILGGSSDSSKNCDSHIVGRTTFGSSQWLLGDAFLKNVYTVFDFDQNRVGLGTINKESTTTSASSSTSSTSGSSSSSTSSESTSPTDASPLIATSSSNASTSTTSSTSSSSQTQTPTPSGSDRGVDFGIGTMILGLVCTAVLAALAL
ncbi:MAG: hypothetical protein M1820_004836 [Bogoriella megaspora]|nr:MAG: hypothetical protein M1820_004836 [Bogoriella megaspora]